MSQIGRVLVGAVSLILLTLPLEAQLVDWDRVEAKSAPRVKAVMPDSYIHPRWINGTPYMYYHVRHSGRVDHYLVNTKSGRSELLIKDLDTFATDYRAITGKELDKGDFRLYNVHPLDRNFRRILLKYGGNVLEYNRRSGRLSKSTRSYPAVTRFDTTDPADRYTNTTTDGELTMLQRGDRLLLCKKSERDTVPVEGWDPTRTTIRNGDRIRPAAGFWCGDVYVHLVTKEEAGKPIGLIHSITKGRPRVETFQMPMPGESNAPRQSLFCYNRKTQRGQYLPIEHFTDQEVSLAPFRSDSVLYLLRTSRPKDRIELCKVNLPDGQVYTLISEEAKPIYNLVLFDYQILSGGQILWWSDRDGYGKYYLYDTTGKLLRQLTHDPALVAGRVVQMREKDFIMEGYGGKQADNSYYKRYFIVPMNGQGEKAITGNDGAYDLTLSDGGDYGLLKCSRMDLPPSYSIMRLRPTISTPKEIYRLSEQDALEAGWVKPTLFSCLAKDDETYLYGIMYTPSDLDPSKKYPVISYVYPGPQTDLMPLEFTLDENANQSLAELGFIVVQVPSRGSSPYRGHDFYTYGHGNLRDYPLEDNKFALEQLADKYPFIDLERVGIYGHSGGGFQALTAMLTYPDFYKACVAASGNYDNNIYIRWWGESFHGVQEIHRPDGSVSFRTRIPTTVELADRLSGPLLLMTGDEDKNVPPSNTLRMADALIKAGKNFEMVVLPGKSHELDSPYYFNKIKYFFLKNLLGIDERHTDIILHK